MPRLDQLCNIQYGYAFNADLFTTKSSQGVPLVRIRDVVRGYTETYTPESFSEAYRVHDGDILIGMDGEFNVARWHGGDAALNQRVCKITPRNNIHSQYLFYFLPQALKRIEDQTPFVTVKHLSAKKLSAIEVPDISMMEQANIAERLDIITTLLANRRQVDEKLAELPKARFVEMFGDPVVNPMGWEKFPLGNLCESIVDCPHSTPTYYKEDTGYGCIRTSIIKKGQILWDNLEYISSTEYAQRIRRRVPRKGDIVYTREGAILGIAAVIDCNRKVALGQRSMLLSPNKKICNETFLCSVMNADTFFTYATRGMNGTASPHINVKDIKKIPVPLPPLPAQRRFAAFARACAAQRAACARQIAVLETLRGKLLQDAFGAAG